MGYDEDMSSILQQTLSTAYSPGKAALASFKGVSRMNKTAVIYMEERQAYYTGFSRILTDYLALPQSERFSTPLPTLPDPPGPVPRVDNDMQAIVQFLSTLTVGFKRMQDRQHQSVESAEITGYDDAVSTILGQLISIAASLTKTILDLVSDIESATRKLTMIMEEGTAYVKWAVDAAIEEMKGNVSETLPPPHPQSDSITSPGCIAPLPTLPDLAGTEPSVVTSLNFLLKDCLLPLAVAYQRIQASQYLFLSMVKGTFPVEDRVGLGNDFLNVVRSERFLERTAPSPKKPKSKLPT